MTTPLTPAQLQHYRSLAHSIPRDDAKLADALRMVLGEVERLNNERAALATNATPPCPECGATSTVRKLSPQRLWWCRTCHRQWPINGHQQDAADVQDAVVVLVRPEVLKAAEADWKRNSELLKLAEDSWMQNEAAYRWLNRDGNDKA